jgi:DHA1 family multidrug resistance protein-like MFS transporter
MPGMYNIWYGRLINHIFSWFHIPLSIYRKVYYADKHYLNMGVCITGMGEAKRNVILLSVFNFLLWASLGVLAPIEVLFLGSLVESSVIKGIILGIPSMVVMIFAPYAIRLSDSKGRKKVILALILISSPFFVLLPFSSSYLIYGFLKAASSVLFLTSPILFAYISDTVKRLGVGYGSVILAAAIGGSFGSLVSGAVGEMFGLGTSYLLLAALALTSVLFILPLTEVRAGTKQGNPAKARGMNMLLLAVLVNSLVFSMHLSARGVLWPLLLEGITEAPAMLSGIVFSLMGLTAAVLSIPSGILSERFREGNVFFLGWMIMGVVGVLLFFATGNAYLFLMFSVIYAVGEILKGPSGSMVLARNKRPVYFGYVFSLGSLGGIIGAVASGFLVYFFGVEMAVLVLGLFVLLPMIPFLIACLLKKML